MVCAECGGDGCDDVFQELLALEFQRSQPHGRLHAVTVAAYGVQHPSRFARRVREAQWSLLWTYSTGGIEAVEEIQDSRREANSRHRGGLGDTGHGSEPSPPFPWDLLEGSWNICDVAGEGRAFLAPGHEERVRQWIDALLAPPPSG